MNHMKEVAALLGIELNEEFELIFPSPSSCHATIMLTIEGVRVINTDVYDMLNFKLNLLQNLIKGSYGIKRKPFKPKLNEKYYSLLINHFPARNMIVTWEYTWRDYSHDYTNYYLGLCFRTKEEAEANKDKMLKFLDHYKEA